MYSLFMVGTEVGHIIVSFLSWLRTVDGVCPLSFSIMFFLLIFLGVYCPNGAAATLYLSAKVAVSSSSIAYEEARFRPSSIGMV